MDGKTLEGYHTMVFLTNGTVDKVYGLKNQPFTLCGALMEAADMVLYERALVNIGINTPKRHSFRLRKHPHGHGLLLVETVCYIPDSVDDLFPDGSPEEILNVATDMFLMISATIPTRGKTIVDTPISNFRRKEAKTYYVDLMPPRGKIRGTYRIERPEPSDPTIRKFLFQRYCGPATPILALNQWCRRRPSLRREFESLISAILATCEIPEPGEFFRKRPALDPRPETIMRFSPYDCDHIRDVACELAYRQQLTEKELRHVFHLAHVVPGGILPSDSAIAEAKMLLMEKS